MRTGQDVKLLREMSKLGSTLSTSVHPSVSTKEDDLRLAYCLTWNVLISSERADDRCTVGERDVVIRGRREQALQ